MCVECALSGIVLSGSALIGSVYVGVCWCICVRVRVCVCVHPLPPTHTHTHIHLATITKMAAVFEVPDISSSWEKNSFHVPFSQTSLSAAACQALWKQLLVKIMASLHGNSAVPRQLEDPAVAAKRKVCIIHLDCVDIFDCCILLYWCRMKEMQSTLSRLSIRFFSIYMRERERKREEERLPIISIYLSIHHIFMYMGKNFFHGPEVEVLRIAPTFEKISDGCRHFSDQF